MQEEGELGYPGTALDQLEQAAGLHPDLQVARTVSEDIKSLQTNCSSLGFQSINSYREKATKLKHKTSGMKLERTKSS